VKFYFYFSDVAKRYMLLRLALIYFYQKYIEDFNYQNIYIVTDILKCGEYKLILILITKNN